jgi:hypothetical protein
MPTRDSEWPVPHPFRERATGLRSDARVELHPHLSGVSHLSPSHPSRQTECNSWSREMHGRAWPVTPTTTRTDRLAASVALSPGSLGSRHRTLPTRAVPGAPSGELLGAPPAFQRGYSPRGEVRQRAIRRGPFRPARAALWRQAGPRRACGNRSWNDTLTRALGVPGPAREGPGCNGSATLEPRRLLAPVLLGVIIQEGA